MSKWTQRKKSVLAAFRMTASMEPKWERANAISDDHDETSCRMEDSPFYITKVSKKFNFGCLAVLTPTVFTEEVEFVLRLLFGFCFWFTSQSENM
jgi:hypothetical protein